MANKYYITTAIDYVNASPHLGHAFEKVLADVLARYHRQYGEEVFFLTGTDEHGVKNVKSAEVSGMTTEDFVNENSAKFKELAEKLYISNDFFIRTTDKEVHWSGVTKMWKTLDENGDIYKKKYSGFYCVGHEAFITKKDMKDGKCILHKKEPEVIQEENYFFRLSKYTRKIKEAVVSGELKIVPDSSRNELLRLLDKDLQDVSFSRSSKDLKWGVPVPGDLTQTIYVWCDALTNYLSAIGYGSENYALPTTIFSKFWPADIHVIGKDILRFHAAIWPGMLISAGLPLPKILFVHGFISVGGEKMSKTIGNVVDPFKLIDKYGAEAVRYYLLREIPSTKDGDFTEEKFAERYSSDLAKGLGNFTSRVVTLGAKYMEKEFESKESEETKSQIKETLDKYHESIENFRFDEALQAVWGLVSYGDRFVDREKLWELAKSDNERFRSDIQELCAVLFSVAQMLEPFLPETARKISDQLGIKSTSTGSDPGEKQKFKLKKGDSLFPMV